MASSDETLPGRLLERRYRIERPIARGGMATVYRATDTRLDRVVAVKVMHAGLGDDTAFVERFEREARSAAKLNHPNVVAVFDQGDDDGTVYLVMELVEGRTLRDVMRQDAPMPPRSALALMEQVLLALSAAHEAHIVHRDVKPENVLIAPDGRVKVADFGLARAVSSVTAGPANTSTGVLIGTVSYLAPELVLSQGSDARSDVYACGAVLYEMLTGYKPHTGETPIQIAYRHVHEDVPPPSKRVGGIPPYLDALIARATTRNRDLRSADARVLLRQLRQVRLALDRGLPDDADLTADLMPRTSPPAAPPAAQPVGGTDQQGLPAGRVDPTLVVAADRGPEPWPMPPTMSGGTAAAVPTASQLPPPPPAAPPDTAPSPDGPTEQKPPPPAPRRRRRGLLWMTVVLLLAVFAAAGGFYFGVMRYSTTPALTGETEASAREIAKDRGLSIEVTDEAYSETVREGTVISTDPEAGDNILDGGTVDVTLSRGEQLYDVPNVDGMTEDQATDALDAHNLDVGKVTPRYSERVDAGDVIRASIKAGKSVKDGTDVNLFVSKGRRPIDVESYVGDPAREARVALEDAGFRVDVSRTHDPEVPAGHVVSQSPDSGSAYRRDTIRLVVSRGAAMVTVPDVRFQSVDDATATLEAAGLKVQVEEDELNVDAGIVRDQDPGADERVQRGTTVTLYVV